MGGNLMEVKFKYGTFEQYQDSEKDSGTLYFLNNSQIYKGDQLMSSVRSVSSNIDDGVDKDKFGFPEIITDSMIGNFFISLDNGEIRYVDSNKNYINVTNLSLEGITISQDKFLEFLYKNTNQEEVAIPKIYMQGNKLVIENVDEKEIDYKKLTIFTKK